MSERITHRHLLGVIITVSYEYPFFILYGLSVSREIQVGGVVRKFEGNSFCQFSAGVHLSKKYVHFCLAYGLSSQISLQDPLYLVCPGHFYRRTVMKDYHHIFLYLCDLRDQRILALGHSHMASVISF